jgi:hypothetical protein
VELLGSQVQSASNPELGRWRYVQDNLWGGCRLVALAHDKEAQQTKQGAHRLVPAGGVPGLNLGLYRADTVIVFIFGADKAVQVRRQRRQDSAPYFRARRQSK